jgi:hypothetical protein
MTERQGGTVMKRRGILAAAEAVVAGIVAQQLSQPVTAARGRWRMAPRGYPSIRTSLPSRRRLRTMSS